MPAPRAFERPFVSDHALLQREARTNDPAITAGAYGIIGLCTFLLLAMLSWGLHRIRVTASPDAYRPASEGSRAPLLATPPAA